MDSSWREGRREGILALLTWSSKYSVSVQALDDQHRRLIGILNELHAAMLKGQAQRVAGPLLDSLLSYTRDHFSTEERMMSEAGFPGLAEHRAKHQELAGQVGDYVIRYRKGDNTIYLQLLIFLRDWLANHIQKEDQEYGPCLNAHGMR
jgi:hemerythrin